MAATPLEELSSYKKKREQMKAILDALYDIGGRVEATPPTSGRGGSVNATTILMGLVDEQYRTNSAGTFNKLREGGWIDAPVRGKRVPYVEMAIGLPWRHPRRPVDEAPTSTTEAAGSSADAEPTPPVEPVVPSTGVDVEEADLGMRPGRLAARLEQSIPTSVVDAVMAAIKADRDAQYEAMGYYHTIPQSEVDEMTRLIDSTASREALMRTRISDLEQELLLLGYEFDLLAERTDEQLARSNDGTPAMKGSLSVEKVKDPFKGLARTALQQGWTIKTTRGGHLAWRSPEGKTVFSGSTSSDSNSHYIMRRKLRSRGLVIEGGTTTQADVDRFAVGSRETSEGEQ